MNNKGQTLVIFVLLLPILFLLFALIWEVGNFELTINHYETIIKDTIKENIKNIENTNEEKILNILKDNIKGNIKVQIKNQIIKINVQENHETLFKLKNQFKIDITYIGYIENSKIIIKKE